MTITACGLIDGWFVFHDGECEKWQMIKVKQFLLATLFWRFSILFCAYGKNWCAYESQSSKDLKPRASWLMSHLETKKVTNDYWTITFNHLDSLVIWYGKADQKNRHLWHHGIHGRWRLGMSGLRQRWPSEPWQHPRGNAVNGWAWTM